MGANVGAAQHYFAGELAGVRISSGARYKTDFTPQERFVPDKDTLALYHFDEGQGDKLTDSSGNNHHGRIVGAKWVKANDARAPDTPAPSSAASTPGPGLRGGPEPLAASTPWDGKSPPQKGQTRVYPNGTHGIYNGKGWIAAP